MALREIKSTGIEALNLATTLLQRARLADPQAGLWEAADVHWSWRTPRQSDDAEKLFWIDNYGPVAGILLTSWNDKAWQIDPVHVPGATGIEINDVWNRAIEHIAANPAMSFELPVGDNDPIAEELVKRSGLTPDNQDSTGWLGAADRPAVLEPADGFVLTDRTLRSGTPHPMSKRNGSDPTQRLEQCSLYDPELDLAVETIDGQVAGYSLYWFDPVTKVGLVEPVRVEDDFQRRGLARTMLTQGIDQLVTKGAERIKVSWETEAAGSLYLGVGFQQTSTTTWYRAEK